MVEEQNIFEEEPKPNASPVATASAYDQLSTISGERDIEVVEEDDGLAGHKSLSERIEESPNLSDIQTGFKELYPKSGTPWLDDIQVSRIFPDVYNPLSRIFVKDLIKKSASNGGSLSLAEAIAKVNTPMSIGIDGEGRIDAIAILGKAAEEEKEKKAIKNLLGE